MRFFFFKLFFFFLFLGTSDANEKIRYININHIINNSEAGITLNKMIEKQDNKIKSEFKNLAKKLEDQKSKILSQKNILKKEEFDKMVKNYDKEVKEFNDLRRKKNDNLNDFRVRSKKRILDLLNPIIINFLKKESIQILLQKEKIIFGDENLDITKEVLEIFNSKHKKIKFE